MAIPAHLISGCLERRGFGMVACDGSCGEDVKQNPETGRWFITMGHCGFNSPANNGAGFVSKGQARRVSIQCRDRGRAARSEAARLPVLEAGLLKAFGRKR